MSCTEWLRQFLFTNARSEQGGVTKEPTGKALYSYRCTDKAYVRLGVLVAEALPRAQSGKQPSDFEACFCMYAAETFRREHSGGSWTWKTIFDPMEAVVPSNPTLGQWVERGLSYWKRPVHLGSGGQHMWLVTIACEGGLPLRLLEQEGAHLRSYFKNILESYHQRRMSIELIPGIASEHIQKLPKSLRNAEVLHLASSLLKRIVELQRETDGTVDPLIQLEAKIPYWRATLPLRLEDSTAEALFKNLLEQSRSLEKQASVRAGWVGYLREAGDGVFRITKQLMFPDRVSSTTVEEWAPAAPAGVPRWRLLLGTQNRVEPVASLTLVPSHVGAELVYRVDWFRRETLALSGEQVLHSHAVLLSTGHFSSQVPLRNVECWGSSPWMFIPSRKPKEWEWFAEGSAQSSHVMALVAVEEGTTPILTTSGTCNKRGDLIAPARTLYEISGEVDFETQEGDLYRFTCGAERESDKELKLLGEHFDDSRNQRVVFLGAPRFFEVTENGSGALARGELQWRPVGDSWPWNSRMADCVGRVWIRLLDQQTGVERIRRKADVLPSSFSMTRRIGVSGASGFCEMTGIANGTVTAWCNDVALNYEHIPGGICIECIPQSVSTISPLSVRFTWPGTHGLELNLNYPQQCAVFHLDGHNLERSTQIAADRLYGLWLHAESPAGATRFMLDVDLMRGNPSGDSNRLGFTDLLPPMKNGVLEVSIGSLSDRIKSLLAADDTLGTQVRLSVRSSGSELARLNIRYHDMAIIPLSGTQRVGIPQEQLARLDKDWRECIRIEVLPLFDPGRKPVPLEPASDGSVEWTIPMTLEPGPWWVVGRDRSWARFRPLLVSVEGEPGQTQVESGTLTSAVREPDGLVRARLLEEVITAMAENPEHKDWPKLLTYVLLASDYAPNSIDPLRHLIRNQDALVMALLRADELAFSRVLALSEQMPFVWGLVSYDSWKKVTSSYYLSLRSSLAGFDGAEEMVWRAFDEVRTRLMTSRPYFAVLCDSLQELLFPDRPLSNSLLRVVRALGIPFLREQVAQAENALLARHEAEEPLPYVPELLRMVDEGVIESHFAYGNMTDVQRTVRCAPFISVAIALKGDVVNDFLVYQLRAVRDFDSEWFDHAYALALAYGLAHKSEWSEV